MGSMEHYVREVAKRFGPTQGLYEAARWSEAEQLEEILGSGAKVDSRTDHGGTALLAASFAGNVVGVGVLIDSGADPNLPSRRDGRTPMMACLGGVHSDRVYMKILTRLLDAGADPSIQDDSSKTALDYARERGCRAVEELLVRRS